MDVGGSTKTDSNGKFSFKITVPGPHLIRAVHQGVNYHQMAPPGVNTADVKVYDVATKVADLSVTADVIRFQADSGTMQGVRLFVVNNTSSPAKTQMNDHNFEFYLPAGAKVEQVQARSPNGQPIPADAVPIPKNVREEPLRHRLPAPSRRNPVPGGIHSALLRRDQDRSQAALSRRAPRHRSSQDDAVQGRGSVQLPVHAGSQPGRQQRRSRAADQARPAARLHAEGQRSHHRVARRDRLGRGPAAGTTGTRQSF